MTKPRLELIEFGIFSGSENMEVDTHLFNICEEDPGRCFLRFYGWRTWCISMGRFEPEGAIDIPKALDDGVEVVRRPTGGRAVMHGDDLTYAVVVPIGGRRPDQIYHQICNCLIEGLKALGIDASFERGHSGLGLRMKLPCFASTSRYEITWKGKKLIGSAQRIGRKALLQHGSIPIGKGYLNILDYVRCQDKDLAALRQVMLQRTCCLEDIIGRRADAGFVADRLAKGFVGRFSLRKLSCGSLSGLAGS